MANTNPSTRRSRIESNRSLTRSQTEQFVEEYLRPPAGFRDYIALRLASFQQADCLSESSAPRSR